VRAIRFDGDQVRLVGNAADPVLLPGEALVHPTRLLVGPADAARVRADVGGSSRLIGVPGHQFVGVVKKIHLPDDTGQRHPLLTARKGLLNKRVVGSPLVVCANCDLCRAGLPGHCRARRVMGLQAREGCFADLFAIPLANLQAVPETMDDDRAVFAWTAAGAVQAGHMLRAAGKLYITVIGDNALGLMTAQHLAAQNKSTRLLYTREDRARLCEKYGLKHRSVEEPGRRQDQDVVVDCTGSPEGLRLALQLVRPRGMVLLKSPEAALPFPPGQPFVEGPRWKQSGVDLAAAIVNEVQILGCREASIAEGLGALADGTIDVSGMISRHLKLDDAAEAFNAAGHEGQLAVVMDV
jgi:threonine dehydrogenase-like Zn-dependent dehydrogenase